MQIGRGSSSVQNALHLGAAYQSTLFTSRSPYLTDFCAHALSCRMGGKSGLVDLG